MRKFRFERVESQVSLAAASCTNKCTQNCNPPTNPRRASDTTNPASELSQVINAPAIPAPR